MNDLEHKFELYQIQNKVNDLIYSKCKICDIVVYCIGHIDIFFISAAWKHKKSPAREALNLSCNDVIIKSIIE